MKKLILFVMAIGLFTSCSKENDAINTEDSETTYQNLSVDFDAEAAYYELLSSETMLEDLGTYSSQEKSLIWQYKYDRTLEETESLNSEQVTIINSLKDFVSPEFFENPENFLEGFNNLSNQVFSNFSTDGVQTPTFILGSLELTQGDGPYITQPIIQDPEPIKNPNGCFWCDQVVPGSEGPCKAVVINGEYTGDFNRDVEVAQYRFGIKIGTTNGEIPCSSSDWWDDGKQTETP